ncbi:MAG: L,D-transpeptidase, partial [Proteobacteria bacterium]|nr:L,D-transpeptidase [Pseudomonadota bacterium]
VGVETGNANTRPMETTAVQVVAAAKGPRLATEAEKSVAGVASASGIHTADASGAMPPLTVPSSATDSTTTATAAATLPVTNMAVATDAPQLRRAIGMESKPAEPVRDKPESLAAPDVIQAEVASASAADDIAAAKNQLKLPAIQNSGAISEPVAAPAPKRSGRPLAVFISRRDSKIYVRQNFTPLFDAPVTITASERPLGTHVFTVHADKDNKNNFHWSVISLPATHPTEHVSARGKSSHRHTVTARVEPKLPPVPDDAADALNRIVVPEDVLTKIAESLSSGGSIVVSDQGIAGGETGEGTDFIVTLR